MNRNRLLFTDQTKTIVKLDGKVVGEIREVPRFESVEGREGLMAKKGWQYFPKGSKTGGEVFKTKGECMYSLYDMGND